MSAKPRCHECKHRRGPRSTTLISKKKGTEALLSKNSCGGACHATRSTSL